MNRHILDDLVRKHAIAMRPVKRWIDLVESSQWKSIHVKNNEMKKILENVVCLTTKTEYDLLSVHLENLIKEATEGGFLADPNENDYTREIARLSALGGRYEFEFMTFAFSKPISSVIQLINYSVIK